MNILKRIVNKVGYRYGIRPFPAATDPMLEAGDNVFEGIQRANYWGSDESISGVGSTLERTHEYRECLIALINQFRFDAMFDAPCGDLNWIGDVVDRSSIGYSGGDIAPIALEQARRNRPDLSVRLFDITKDTFPQADVWHCRDCLFHLSYDMGLAALRNFTGSSIPYALLTTHNALWLKNIDVVTGGFRLLDLQRSPFSLPQPVAQLQDYPPGAEFPRYVCLWTREQIAEAIN